MGSQHGNTILLKVGDRKRFSWIVKLTSKKNVYRVNLILNGKFMFISILR